MLNDGAQESNIAGGERGGLHSKYSIDTSPRMLFKFGLQLLEVVIKS